MDVLIGNIQICLRFYMCLGCLCKNEPTDFFISECPVLKLTTEDLLLQLHIIKHRAFVDLFTVSP